MSEIPELEGGEALPVENEEAAPVEVQPNESIMVATVQEKRKKRVSVNWNRPKSHLYEYNYDYGANYYKAMVDYLDKRGSGYKLSPPKAQSWAERALQTYSEKREARGKGNKDPDVELLHRIRNSVHTYTVHTKTYNRKVTSHLTYNN